MNKIHLSSSKNFLSNLYTNSAVIIDSEGFYIDPDTPKDLMHLFTNAMNFSYNTCIIGSSNRIVDREKTGDYTLDGIKTTRKYYNDTKNGNIWQRNYGVAIPKDSIELASKPKNEPSTYDQQELNKQGKLYKEVFNLPYSNVSNLFGSVCLAAEGRVGNCGELSSLVFYDLWQRNAEQIHRIEKIAFAEVDHVFVVINRDQRSDFSYPQTWDAIILDPWDRKIYPSTKFAEEARKTVRNLYNEEKALNRKITYNPETVPLHPDSQNDRNHIELNKKIPSKNSLAPDYRMFRVQSFPLSLVEKMERAKLRSHYTDVMSELESYSKNIEKHYLEKQTLDLNDTESPKWIYSRDKTYEEVRSFIMNTALERDETRAL